MKFYHLSHTDLDGYGCQLISKQYFNDAQFYNANYGLEVKLSLEMIIEDINAHLDEEIFLLISDLNLTTDEAKGLNNTVNRLNEDGASIKLQLLDHHATGEKSAQNHPTWYYLDTQRCATKIVYEYFIEHHGKSEIDSWLAPMVDCINAIDIWLDDETHDFEFGKVLLLLISKAQEINATLFADLNRNYRLYLLEEAAKFLEVPNRHIALDDAIHGIKKRFLQRTHENNTIANLSAHYLVDTLEEYKEQFTVTYKEHKGLLTYTLGSISIPANAFLKANPDFDFFIDVGRRGHVGFRADDKINVGIMASKIAGGGGHPNASGGKFKDFRETIIYDDVKNYIQNKLNKLQM
ncbi:MAG: phosphoesterase [Campylobacterota bacterium]|nr:phosphoesterase [Campylobacterota bacterium]